TTARRSPAGPPKLHPRTALRALTRTAACVHGRLPPTSPSVPLSPCPASLRAPRAPPVDEHRRLGFLDCSTASQAFCRDISQAGIARP
ncbi:hypothetical protein P154DRAFT_550585, partial [Amniculicola lignicola CBS 123094]